MDNIITTPLGILYFKPKKDTDKYFDKLFVYHDRFGEDDDSVVDVLGFVSVSAYSGAGSELTKTFITNIGDFVDLFEETYSLSVTEYMLLSGLINYLTFGRFKTINVDINQSPDTKKNKKLMYEEVNYYINKINSYIDYLCLTDIVDLEFKKYEEEKKGTFENIEKE